LGLWANLYQKIPILAILGAVSPHFKSDIGEIWHEGVGLGMHPHAKFCKNRLRGYTHLGKIYTKNYFSLFKPTFLKPQP